MIATHRIKVNGRWVAPGEEYGEPQAEREEMPAETAAEAKPARPKTARKRK